MEYQEALEFIHGAGKFSARAGLENMRVLMDLLGNPQDHLRILHVAGTNGKGSTSSMLHSVLTEQGYKVGLFISPYLEKFTERIQIDREPIPQKALGEITQKVQEKIQIMLSRGLEHPIEFEIVTAIGLTYFAQQQVDFVVLEVGLGGRYDATNVISASEVSIITPIGLDHRAQLGQSLGEIAREKAGIIKKGGNVVLSFQETSALKAINQKAHEQQARVFPLEQSKIQILESTLAGQKFSYQGPLLSLPTISIGLLGSHQVDNAATALRALEVLKEKGVSISTKAILSGFSKAQWPGRFEILSTKPHILLDGAHNVQGARAFSQAMQTYFPNKKITLMIGMVKDKEVKEVLKEILPLAQEVYALGFHNPRALDPKELKKIIQSVDPGAKCTVIQNPKQALQWAEKTPPEEVNAFTGSLYMIGEARSLF